MEASARIAKNTTYLTVASIIQKIISFGYFAIVAKTLGDAQLGKYTFALAFSSIFIIFMDFGLGPLLTREGAKDESKLDGFLQEMLSVKFVLMAASLVFMIASIHVADAVFERVDSTDVLLVYIGSVIIIFDTLTFSLFSIFRAVRRLFWEALAIIIYQSTILGVGLFFLYNNFPLPYILGALLAGSVVQFIYLYIIFRLKAHLHFRFKWSWKTTRRILALSAPFAIAGIIFRLNGSVDSIMLKIMAGDSYAGWYGLSFKLVFALTVFPGAFATSYFPAVSTYFKNAKHKLHEAFESGFVYMCILSFPIVAGVAILGDDIILTVWDEAWTASIQALWILIIAVPFIFANYPVGNFLNAVDKQKLNTVNMFIALAVNIVLNSILIPHYTFIGAAIAVVASSIVLVLLGIPWVYRIAPFQIGYLTKKISIIAFAASIMAFVLFFIQHTYPLLISILIGILIYGAALYLLNGITNNDLSSLKKAILRKGSS